MNTLTQRLLKKLYKILDVYKKSKCDEELSIDLSTDRRATIYRFSLSKHGRDKFMATWSHCKLFSLGARGVERETPILIAKLKKTERISESNIESDTEGERLLELTTIIERWIPIEIKKLNRC